MARKGIVLHLLSTAVAHDAVADANGWQDNAETEQLAREHYSTRRRATPEEIAEYEQIVRDRRNK